MPLVEGIRTQVQNISSDKHAEIKPPDTPIIMALFTESSYFDASVEDEGEVELDSIMGFLCLFGNPPLLTGTPSRTSTSLTRFLDAQVTTNSMIL